MFRREIVDPIFRRHIDLLVGPDLWGYLHARFPAIEFESEPTGSAARCLDIHADDYLRHVVWLDSWKRDDDYIARLAHEGTHLSRAVGRVVGIPLDTEEFHAYYVGFFLREALKKLRAYR